MAQVVVVRTYTLQDIDRLRELIADRTPQVERWVTSGGGTFASDMIAAAQHSAMESHRNLKIEERLRTYMIAGIGPEDFAEVA